MALADALGNLVRFVLLPGQRHDSVGVTTLIADIDFKALIADKAFEDLDGPVRRVATPDVPIPFSPPLEQAVLPSVDRVKEAARELLEY